MTQQRHKRLSRILAIFFVGILAIPLAMFLLGVRGEPIENRAATPRPDVGPGDLFDTNVTVQIDDYLTDALPLRHRIVEFDARIDRLIGDSPNPEVIIGRDGWLFWTETTGQPCVEGDYLARFADVLERSARLFAAVNRRLVIALGPDKASIYPEQLPRPPHCPLVAAANLAELEVEAEFVRVWDELRVAKPDGPLYLQFDTHWNASGAAIMADAIIEQLSPGAWQPDAVRVIDEKERTGDLSLLMGLPAVELETRLASRLVGAESAQTVEAVVSAAGEPIPGLDIRRYRSDAAGAAPVPGNTVVLHDSYGWALIPLVSDYFEDAMFVRQIFPAAQYLREPLAWSETVVRLATQRSFVPNVVENDMAGQFVVAFRSELPVIDTEVHVDGATTTVEVEDTAGDEYVLVTLAPGATAATVTVSGAELTLSPETPAVGLPAVDGRIVFAVAGDVEITGALVPPG